MGMEWLTEQSVSIGSVGIPNWAWLVIALAVVIVLIIVIAVAVSRKKKKSKEQPAAISEIECETEQQPVAEESAEEVPVAHNEEAVEEASVTQNKEGSEPAAKEEIKENKAEAKPKLVEKPATTTKKTYHISLRKADGMWQVKAAGAEKAIKLFKTQAEAIEYCKPLAQNQDANIMIHKKDGSFRKLTY